MGMTITTYYIKLSPAKQKVIILTLFSAALILFLFVDLSEYFNQYIKNWRFEDYTIFVLMFAFLFFGIWFIIEYFINKYRVFEPNFLSKNLKIFSNTNNIFWIIECSVFILILVYLINYFI